MKEISPIGNLLSERLQVASEGYRKSKNDGLESACNEFVKGLIPEIDLGEICSFIGDIGEKVKGLFDNIDLGNLL